ncbi:MAG: molybdopterin dinucleotide binding domain-containing protein, partial [Bacteroidales bacterium]
GTNPVKARIPTFLWTEAVIRGTSLTAKEGLTGADHLQSNIKFIWSVASNILANQHGNVNRAGRILADESLVEFIVVQDQFMTASARYADLVLPVCTHFETWGLADGWKYGEEVILLPQVVENTHQAKSDYRICADLSAKLGVFDAFTEGLDEKGWTHKLWDEYRVKRFPDLPPFDQFVESNQGVYSIRVDNPKISLEEFRRDPENHPLDTPSGKIEIFSETLFKLDQKEVIPAVPKYIQEWESPFGPEAETYPLQAIGPHYMARVHSIHDNTDWLKEAFPQRVFINPLDAKNRNLSDGERVLVFNDRGKISLPCRITPRIMPGVVSVPQGAWTVPGPDGTDTNGNINVLSSEKWTPLAFGNAQHTIMVEIKKTKP